MTAKMPYLNEDEIVVNGKTTVNSISSTSDVDDAEESFFENKVKFHNFKLQFSVIITSRTHFNFNNNFNLIYFFSFQGLELISTEDDEATNSSTSSYDSNDSPSRKRNHFDPDAVIATALNYLTTTEPAQDELWQFMSYLHTVLRKLPPHLQLELKQKIQNAMFEVEKQEHDGAEKDVPEK